MRIAGRVPRKDGDLTREERAAIVVAAREWLPLKAGWLLALEPSLCGRPVRWRR